MYLSAVLEFRGHQAQIFIDVRGNDALKGVLEYDPQVLGVSCTTGLHHWGIDFCRKIKLLKPGIITLIGGPHATFCPQVALESGVDFAVRGEAEKAIVEIAERVNNPDDIPSLPNIAFSQNGGLVVNPLNPLVEDLDTIPFPDRSYYERYPLTLREGSKNFIAGRGCPYHCSFCANYEYHRLYQGLGRWVRYRSYENILEEIEQVKNRYGLRFVGFSDDTLIFNRQWLLPFLELYRKRIGLPFLSTVRANLVDEELVKSLKEAGCISCVFGVESGVEKIRNETLQKGVTDDQIRHTASLFKKYRIKFGTYNMLGLPGETIRDAFQTVSLNAEIRPDFPWCSILQPYPGTKIHKEMEISLGKEIKSDEISASYFTASVIDNPHIKQMENLQKFFHIAVRIPVLKPVIRVLIKFPPNFLFTLIFQACYGWQLLRRSKLNLIQMLKYWWTQQAIFNGKQRSEAVKIRVPEEAEI